MSQVEVHVRRGSVVVAHNTGRHTHASRSSRAGFFSTGLDDCPLTYSSVGIVKTLPSSLLRYTELPREPKRTTARTHRAVGVRDSMTSLEAQRKSTTAGSDGRSGDDPKQQGAVCADGKLLIPAPSQQQQQQPRGGGGGIGTRMMSAQELHHAVSVRPSQKVCG